MTLLKVILNLLVFVKNPDFILHDLVGPHGPVHKTPWIRLGPIGAGVKANSPGVFVINKELRCKECFLEVIGGKGEIVIKPLWYCLVEVVIGKLSPRGRPNPTGNLKTGQGVQFSSATSDQSQFLNPGPGHTLFGANRLENRAHESRHIVGLSAGNNGAIHHDFGIDIVRAGIDHIMLDGMKTGGLATL